VRLGTGIIILRSAIRSWLAKELASLDACRTAA